MARKTKIGNHQGVAEWAALNTIGDVKRFIAWCIHSVRDQSMDTKTASCLGQLGCYLMKAVEIGDFEDRLSHIELALKMTEGTEHEKGPTTHH